VADSVYVKVYRVSEVFEVEVDEDTLEKEDFEGRPALREAMRMVHAGELDGGPPDVEFVALAWDETAQVQAAALVRRAP
jgi:hypothetical protein